ncbi:MAG: UbiD family decarboxylase, partial [Alphaproteobacteria bacterium]
MKNDITSLRSALDWLKQEGDVIETDKEVDPDLEITGLQKHFDGGPVMLFNNVKGKPHARAITNLFGDINVVEKLFGWKDSLDRVKKVAHAIDHPTPPVEISQDEAPVQEEIITEDVDPNAILTPIRHTALETELTIGSGISCVIGDYFDGGSHIGYNRMNFRWGNVGTFQISPGSHMWQIMTEHYRDEEPIPLTMCFGVPPACTFVAGS